MTPNRVTIALEKYSKYIEASNQVSLKTALGSAGNHCTEEFMTLPVKSPVATILLSIFLGGLGIDRFYIGDKKMGMSKLIARIAVSFVSGFLGILGGILSFAVSIWMLADIYYSFKKCKELNFSLLYSFLIRNPVRSSSNTSSSRPAGAQPFKPKNNLNNAMGEGSGILPSRGRLSDFAEELAVENRGSSEEGKEEVFGMSSCNTSNNDEDENAPHTTGYNSLNDMDEDEESGTPLGTNTNRDDGRRAGEDASSGRSTSNPFSW